MKNKERLEQLQGLIDALDTDDLWQRWLKHRRHHRKRSWRNQLLIALQRPDASYVEGYTVWRDKFNRQVVKGAKAIWVLAPAPLKVELENDAGEVEVQKRAYFKPVTVFAFEDTMQIPDRPAIPIEAPLAPIEGDSHDHLWPAFSDVALACGVSSIEKEELPSRQRGYYRPSETKIALNADCSPNEALAVGLHELAHHLVAQKLDRGDWPDSYAGEEVLVEATSYCVCQAVGLETEDHSARYVSAWGKDALNELIGRVDELAREIEAALVARAEFLANSREPATA
jgi:antirestriction protein ArdC